MSRLSPKAPVARMSVRKSFLRRAAVSVAALGLAVSGATSLPLWAMLPYSKTEKLPPPAQIVADAPASEWVSIAPSDLVVMQLAPDAKGRERRVVIQLMPAPFSQGWVGNIRTLVATRWYDGVSVNRVQDNYVVQWGDANGEDAAKAKAKALPEERVPILSVRMGDETPDLSAYEYLDTNKDGFANYAYSRANRQDAFFIRPAGGADICNIPVPVRRKPL